MRDDEFWLRPPYPAPRPGTMAALVRARRALAELAGLSSVDYRPMVERAAREVEDLAPFVASIPLVQAIERIEEILEDLPASDARPARKLADLREALLGGGPEARREGTIAEAAGRTT